jgi:hypothetical protein
MNEGVRRMDEAINEVLEIVVLQKDRSFCLSVSLESRPKQRKKLSSMMSGGLRG